MVIENNSININLDHLLNQVSSLLLTITRLENGSVHDYQLDFNYSDIINAKMNIQLTKSN